MDGIFDTIMRLFISPGTESIIPVPTFSYYEIATLAMGKTGFVDREPDFNIDPEKIIDKVNKETRMIFLCSPNNPSGNSIPEKDARKILESVDTIVFIDEAYVEFADTVLQNS